VSQLDTSFSALPPVDRVRWSELPPGAKAFRIAHVIWGVGGLASLGYVWLAALRRRRDRALAGSVTFLVVEGIALLVGRGDCPFGPFQQRLGDPVPMFELVLPPRAAKAAVPLLTGLTLAGFVAVALRGPRAAAEQRRPAAAGGQDVGSGPSMRRRTR
jgi:hypothetical protein